jgi:hypothetical protein
VNRDAVGVQGEPFELDVERGRIRELAKALFADDEAYWRSEPVVPPTFLTTMFMWETPASDPWPKLELDRQRALHASQEFEFLGPPPRAGTRLTACSQIEEIYEKEGRRGGNLTFAVMRTDFTDADGRVVARARGTVVETSRPPEAGA